MVSLGFNLCLKRLIVMDESIHVSSEWVVAIRSYENFSFAWCVYLLLKYNANIFRGLYTFIISLSYTNIYHVSLFRVAFRKENKKTNVRLFFVTENKWKTPAAREKYDGQEKLETA